MADFFVDEFIEPDELIQVGDTLYGVIYMQTSNGDQMPLYIRVDEPSMLKDGVAPSQVYATVDEVEEANGEFVFMEYEMGMSEVMTLAELSTANTTIDKILGITQDRLEYNARHYGDHYLDLDMQYAFALSALLNLDTVPTELLSETSWYKSHPSAEARAWAEFSFQNEEEATQIINDNLAYYKLEAGSKGLAGEDINNLIADLNSAVTTGKITKTEANDIIKNLGDSARRKLMGGDEVIHEDFRKYIGKIEETRSGYSAAEILVLDYGGPLLLDGYKNNGKLDEIAAKLRLDTEYGTSNNEILIKEDLQKAADALYPWAKGSKYSGWAGSFESLTTKILGQKTLTPTQLMNVARQAQKFQGNYQDFETYMYKEYIDTPYIQEEILGDASRSLQEDVSGVFNASTIYRR